MRLIGLMGQTYKPYSKVIWLILLCLVVLFICFIANILEKKRTFAHCNSINTQWLTHG